MAMMVVLAAVLLTYGVSPGIAMKKARNSGAIAGAKAGGNSVLPLDMAEKSVDDMYDGCREAMKQRVTEDLQNEKNNNPNFKEVWDLSEKKINDKFKRMKSRVLEKDQIVAIYYYTSGKGGAHRDFNDAVRTQGSEYTTAFRYHALHFLLTTAIQAKRKKNQCLTVYRRVDRYFRQDVKKNTKIRFGSFTSASQGDYLSAERFGDKSCFKIDTCMGVDVSLYSKFENEAEVLIPPYEVFKVVGIKKRSTKQPDLPCEVVYTVKSTKGYKSNFNCALFPK